MMGVTACHLLIIAIEFSSPSPTLWDSHFRTPPPPVATLPFHRNLPFLCLSSASVLLPPPPPPRRPVRAAPQPSPAATPGAPSTDAPRATASTTTTWCASPATKATLWKGRLPPSARPPASGASSPPPAEVGPSRNRRATVTMFTHAN